MTDLDRVNLRNGKTSFRRLSPNKMKIFSPTRVSMPKIMTQEEINKKESKTPCFTSQDVVNYSNDYFPNPYLTESQQFNSPMADYCTTNSCQIVIDLQKEYDEDQELLDMLEPNKSVSVDKKHNKIKTLCDLKQAKIEMIPEEDEEKQRNELKNVILKEKKHILLHKNNGKVLHSKGFNNHNKQHERITSRELPLNQPHLMSMQKRLIQAKERKEIAQLLLPNVSSNDKRKESKLSEKSVELLHSTQDSSKKQINNNNNSTEEINCIGKQISLYENFQQCSSPLLYQRPMSNLRPETHINLMEDNPYDTNNQLKKSHKEFRNHYYTLGDKKRLKIGSAPGYDELITYEKNPHTCIPRNNRPLHQIRIEKGLASTRLINDLTLKIINDFNSGCSSIIRNKKSSNNEPIKIIKI